MSGLIRAIALSVSLALNPTPIATTKLTTATKAKIPTGEFAQPGRRDPIEDLTHVRNALARVAHGGTPAEITAVRRKVHRLHPELKQKA